MKLLEILSLSPAQQARQHICGPEERPCRPNGDRLLILPFPVVEESDGGIAMPDSALEYRCGGWIVCGGLQAMAKMYDQSFKVGDAVIFGQYSNVWTDWSRYLTPPPNPDCEHVWSRDRTGAAVRGVDTYVCDKCGVRRDVRKLWIVHFDDILANLSLEQRIAAGELYINRGVFADGRTCFKYEKPDPDPVLLAQQEAEALAPSTTEQ